MSKYSGLPKAILFSYVLIEKFADFIFFVFLLTVVSIKHQVPDSRVYLLSGGVIAVFSLGIWLYIKFNRHLLNIMSGIMRDIWLDKMEVINRNLLSGLQLFKTSRQIIVSILYFLASWTCICCIFYLVSWPFLEPLGLPLYAPVVLMIFSAISLAIPSAPAAVGTMHYAFLLAVNLMLDGNYDYNKAAAFAVVLHFWVILFDFIAGALLLGANKLVAVSATAKK